MATVTKTGNYLDEIAAALPDAVKQAIIDSNPDEADLTDNPRSIAAAWDGMTPEERQQFFDTAGLDKAAAEQVNKSVADAHARRNDSSDPKNRFNQEGLDGEDVDDGDPSTEDRVTGETDPNETEEEIAARKKRYDEQMQKLHEDEEKKRKEKLDKDEKDKKKDDEDPDAEEGGPDSEFKMGNLGYYGIQLKDGYMSIRPKGKRDPRTKQRSYDENQLRAILLTAVLEKGMRNLQFYKGGKINGQLASQAESMIVNDSFLQKAFEGLDVKVTKQLTPEPPPWCTGSVSKWMHRRRLNEQTARNQRLHNDALRKGRRQGRSLKGRDGKNLVEDMEGKDGKPLVEGRFKLPGWLKAPFARAGQAQAEPPQQQAAGPETSTAEPHAHDGHEHEDIAAADTHEETAGETGEEEREERAAGASTPGGGGAPGAPGAPV